MDLDDKLNRLIQESGVFESEEVASDNDAADIVDYYASSGDEWTSDVSRQTKTITGVHLTAATRSFQVPQRAQSPKNISANSNTEQASSTGMLLNLNVPSFSGISQKCMKLNEETGLFETDSESSSEICGDKEVTLNLETGLFEIIETEIEPLSEVKTGKKRLSRQEQWERTKKIKSNLKNHALKDLPDCRCNCKNKLSKKDCETVLTKFINLKNHTQQNIYLQGCLQEINPKRLPKTTKTKRLQEQEVFEYIINLPKKSIKVCQKVFLAIHDIKRERLVCKVQHQEKDISDGRGRQSQPKFDIESVKKAHEFIDNLPVRQSHYSRASSKHKKFLDSHLSIAELHRKFCIDYPEYTVSYEKFRCIFNQDFNISFGQPRKDICTTCEKFKVNITSAELGKKTNKAKQLKTAHELHLRKAQVFLKSLSKVEKEKPSNTLTLCFDFQKKLPLPVTNITDEYYLRQLWLHNFGVHDLSKNVATMFLFTENYAHKGPNEVITALDYYITKEKTPCQRELDLYCDNAFSQNKNRYVFTYLDQLCAKEIFEKITVSYPIPGHSMMPIDRDFALIERKKKKQEKIYTPEYYVELIKNSKNNNKFNIVFLEKSLMKECNSEVVLKVKDYKKLYDVRIKTNLPGISKCRKVTFRKIGKPEISMSMKGLDMKPLSLYKVGYSRRINEVPENCYDAPLTLKAVKLQDIKRLLEFVPKSERYFYDDLFNDTRDPITVESDSADEVE